MGFKKRFDLVERDEIFKKSFQCLWAKSGKDGREYLLGKRGLSEETVKKFQLGYLPFFVKHQLKGRVILPLFDASKNLIAIGSREILKPKKRFLPVYWHESYQKTFYLYGIDNARKELRRCNFAIVTEGQIDVLQLHNHGIRNVVGLCGNKMSDVQISVINRYCHEIVLLLDKDENLSGQRGADKILNNGNATLSYCKLRLSLDGEKMKFPAPWNQQQNLLTKSFSTMYRNLLSVTLPENSDPDEFVRKHGSKELKNIIERERREFVNRH